MTEAKKTTNMKLIIPLEAWQQMMAYTQLATGEITWFFDVEFDTLLESFLIGAVYLLPQEATGGSVEMEEPDISKFMLALIDQGIEQLPRGWGHSHVDMTAYFSSTDENAIAELDTGSFLVALVVNKKREYEATVKFNYPDFDARIDLKITIDYALKQIPEEYRLEVADKVKHKVFTPKKDFYKGKKAKLIKPEDYDSLDPAIQEQLRLKEGTAGGERVYSANAFGDERVCTKCWYFEFDHRIEPKACRNPNYRLYAEVASQIGKSQSGGGYES